MRRSALFAAILTLLASTGVAAQTLSGAERWFYPAGGIHGRHWRMLTRLPRNGSWRVLEVDGSPFGGTRLQVYFGYARNGSVPGTIQEWYIVPAGRDGGTPMFRVINREVKKCLDTMADGDSLSVRPCSGTRNQLWTVLRNDAGRGTTFSLSSVATRQVLEFPSNADGGRVRLAAFRNTADQALQLDAILEGAELQYSTSNYEVPYQLRPRNAEDKNVQVAGGNRGDDAPVDIFAAAPTAPHHRFSLYRSVTIDYYPIRNDPTGWDDTHFLVARHSAKCPNVDRASTGPGAAIRQWPCFGSGWIHAAWYILPAKDTDFFYLFNANSGLTLTVRGGGGANNAPLEQNFFTGADAQQFRFVR
jgi:hypothetical protein